jgi:hypothetical protein
VPLASESSARGSFTERRSNVFEKVLETLKVATDLDPIHHTPYTILTVLMKVATILDPIHHAPYTVLTVLMKVATILIAAHRILP